VASPSLFLDVGQAAVAAVRSHQVDAEFEDAVSEVFEGLAQLLLWRFEPFDEEDRAAGGDRLPGVG